MTVVERVRELVEPLLAERDLEVVDVAIQGATLRVTVDRPGGVDLDAVSAATHLVSGALDRADPVPGRYVLEVSSPGVERPLRTPEHFRRFVGTPVAVKTRPSRPDDPLAADDSARRVEGVLEAADGDGIIVAGRRVAYDDIERARTVFAWGTAATQRKAVRGKKAKAS